jgi:hypothetical protein
LKRTAAPAQFLTLDLAKDIGDIVEEMQQRTPGYVTAPSACATRPAAAWNLHWMGWSTLPLKKSPMPPFKS